MKNGRTIFSQLIEYLPNEEFQKCVSRYRGDYYVKKFSCWDESLSMAFAQLTYRDGLWDIQSCLQSVGSKTYHMDFRSKRYCRRRIGYFSCHSLALFSQIDR